MSKAGRITEERTSGRHRFRRHSLGAGCLALCAAFVTAPARADIGGGGQSGGSQTGSLGFKLGDNNGRLHPFIDIDTHWVTNPGRLPSGPNDLESTGRVGFDLFFPSDAIELRSDAFVAYNKYWGVQSPFTASFSTFSGLVAINATINKESNLVLRLNESVVRSADPGNQSITARLQHWVEQAGAAVDIKPGGGTLLLTVGCGYYYDKYDDNQRWIPVTGFLDNWRLLPELRLTWKFLPKTGVFIEGIGMFTFYNKNTESAVFGPISNINSNMVNASVGLAGEITPKINALIKGGYGNTLMATGQNLQTWVAAIDFNFAFSETARLDVGALRALQPASLFRYDVVTGGYIRYTHQVAQNTFLAAAPSFNYYTYGTALEGPTIPPRADTDLLVDLSIKQGLAEWLAISLIDRLDWRTSNYQTAIGNAGYFFNDIYLRIDFRY